MTLDQAQEIVSDLVESLSDNEKLRLLGWANNPRSEQILESTLVQKKLRGGPPGKPDQQKMTMAVAMGKPK